MNERESHHLGQRKPPEMRVTGFEVSKGEGGVLVIRMETEGHLCLDFSLEGPAALRLAHAICARNCEQG